MTEEGGTNCFTPGCLGTIFSYNISTDTETVLYDFGYGGVYPLGSLIQVNDSLLYGMTFEGGNPGDGIIFSFNIYGDSVTNLFDFGTSIGYNPRGSLVHASNGLLYGMTPGGSNGDGAIFSYNISTDKTTDLLNFDGTDGNYPCGDLIEVDKSTGINQLSLTNNQLSIYPNPTSGQFIVKTNGNQNGYTVEVYNLMGEEIYVTPKSPEGDFQKQTIDLSSQPAGLYFVYLKSGEGVEVGKVLVTK